MLAATPALSQQVRTLPAPDATYDEPFSAVSGLRELSNGRVVVADARDKVLSMVDLAAQSATTIGREGSGPGEFGLPMRLFVAPRDTTYLFDPLNSRYLVISPDGKAVDQFRAEARSTAVASGDNAQRREVAAPGSAPSRPPAAGNTPAPRGAAQGARPAGGQSRVFGPGGPGGLGFGIPVAADAQGRVYFESSGFSVGENGQPVTPDSAVITRFDRRTGSVDSLAWVKLAKSNVQMSGSANNQRVMIGGANPLAVRDAWNVFPDGRVAIVRGADYRVDMVSPNGSITRGQPVKYTPIKFTEADRKEEEALRNRARQNSLSISISNGPGGTQRSAQMGPGANAPPLEPLTDWPAVKPPFRPGTGATWARANGELWVRRMEPAGAKGTLYDVFNASGVVTHQVRVPEGLNLVGTGNGTVYTTKADEDDLLYLQRHRI
jgi:hypothetical protein